MIESKSGWRNSLERWQSRRTDVGAFEDANTIVTCWTTASGQHCVVKGCADIEAHYRFISDTVFGRIGDVMTYVEDADAAFL